MDCSTTQSSKRNDLEKDASSKDLEICGPLYRGGACSFNSCGHSSDHYHCPICGHSTSEVSQAMAHVRASPACKKDAAQGQYPSCSLAMSSDAASANSMYNAIYGGLTAQNAFPATGYTGYGQMDSFQWHPSMSVDKVAICSTQLSPCCSSNGANRIPVDGQLCSPLGDLYSKVTAPVKDLVGLPAKSGGTMMDSQAWFAAYNSQQIQKPVYKYPDQNSLPQINFLLLDPSDQKHQDMNFLSAVDPNLNMASGYSVKPDYSKADLNGRDLLKESYCTYASQSMTGILPEDAIFSLQLSDDSLKQADLFHNHQQAFLPQLSVSESHTSTKKGAKLESASNTTKHVERFTQQHFGNCVSSCSVYSSVTMPVKLPDQNDENSNQTTSSASDSDESDIIVEDTGDELGNEITESEISIEDIKCSLLQGVVSEEENIHNIPKGTYRGKSRRDSEKLRKEPENLGDLRKEPEHQHEPCSANIRCAVCSKSVSEETPGSFFIQMSNVLPVTSSSNTPILSKLSQIISTNIVELLNDFGHFICQRCFNLVDAVDALETKLESAKQNLTSIFKSCTKHSISNRKQCSKLVVDLMDDNQQGVIEIPLSDSSKRKSPVQLEEVVLQNVDPLLARNIETNPSDCRSNEDPQCCADSRERELNNVVNKDPFLLITNEVVTSADNEVEIQSSSLDSCQKRNCTENKCLDQCDSSGQETHSEIDANVLPTIPALPTTLNPKPILHPSSEQQNLSDLRNHFFNKEKQTETPLLVSKPAVTQAEDPGENHEKSKICDSSMEELSCEKCTEVFTKCEDLKNHESIHHNTESSLLCETCGKRFQHQKQLDDHKARHRKVLNVHCQYCGKSFPSASFLLVHVRSHTGEKPFSCSSCKRGFAHRSNLTAHQNICSGLSPFRCEKCQQLFPLQSALDKHVRTAHDLRLECLKCTECNRSFSKPSDLQAHQRVHSSERSFACEICGRRYKSLGNLNHHTKSHMPKRPFSCEICDLGFLRKDSLEAHVLTHKGEKPYACDICPKSFWSKKNLKTHIKWHNGTVKKNTCPVCDKTFSQKLRVHMRTHTGERPFGCQFCCQRFSTKSSLNKHYQSKHSSSPPLSEAPVSSCPPSC